MKRLVLFPVLGNKRETQGNSARRKPARLEKSNENNLGLSHKFCQIRTLQGRKARKNPILTQNKKSLCGCHQNYPRCNVKLLTYILELGITYSLDCLNRRPMSHYNLDISFQSQNRRTFLVSKRLLILELRGDVPDTPQKPAKANPKVPNVSAISYIPPKSKNRYLAKAHFIC